MKIQTQQLNQQLTKEIAPLYLISSDELLLTQEACALIRHHAKQAGYKQREVFYVETGFNWGSFLTSINNLSLFGEHTLIELHIKSKLTPASSKILQNYAKNPTPNKVVLIVTYKLEAAQQKTAWFKAIDAAGIVLLIWPVNATQLPGWIANRLQLTGLKIPSQGIKLLAEYATGNILAAAQEIEKLHLLYGNGNLTNEQIITVLTDNARFNVFNLLDTAFVGNTTLLIRMLDNLKAEGTEPAIILWAITRELRLLLNISFAVKQGITIEQAMAKNNVWDKRKILIKQALTQHNVSSLQKLIQQAARVDLIIKGADKQRLLWHEIYQLYSTFSQKNAKKNYFNLSKTLLYAK